MKVELNIDASNIGETIIDMFTKLTEEQKETIALTVLSDWLKSPELIEKSALHREALEYARPRRWNAELSEAKLMETSEYKYYLKDKPTTKTLMIHKITSEVIKYHEKAIGDMIRSDPEMDRIMKETMVTIKENFPKIVNDAMIAWFCSNMQTMAQGVGTALHQSQSASQMVQQLTDRINSR